MPIARDGTGSGNVQAVGTTTLVITFGTTASRHLVIGGSTSNSGAPTVQDNTATAWTVKSKVAANGAGAGTQAAFVAYRKNAPAITSVTCTWGATVHANAALDQWTGVNDFDLQTNADGVAATDIWGSGNLTPSVGGCLIYAVGSGDDSSTEIWVAPGVPWTTLISYGDTNINTATFSTYQIAPGTSPISMNFNYQGMSDSTFAGASLLVSFTPTASAAALLGQACL